MSDVVDNKVVSEAVQTLDPSKPDVVQQEEEPKPDVVQDAAAEESTTEDANGDTTAATGGETAAAPSPTEVLMVEVENVAHEPFQTTQEVKVVWLVGFLGADFS